VALLVVMAQTPAREIFPLVPGYLLIIMQEKYTLLLNKNPVNQNLAKLESSTIFT
jgi:hypothetical protein